MMKGSNVSVVVYHPARREFSVEEPPPGTQEPETSVDVLRLRILQQQILADFGVLALKGTPFLELLDQATRSAAAGLEAEFAKVLEYLPDANRFLVCAPYRKRPVKSASVFPLSPRAAKVLLC